MKNSKKIYIAHSRKEPIGIVLADKKIKGEYKSVLHRKWIRGG